MRILIAILLLVCTVFVFLQMRPTGKKLITTQTQLGILNLEFAYDSYHTSKVLTAWKDDEKIASALKNTYIDFGFLFFYSLFLFFCCKNLAKNFTGKIRSVGILLSKAALIAGALDVLENSGMLITLSVNQSTIISLFTAICASVKWLLALLAVLYVLFTTPAALYLFIKNPKTAMP